VRGAVFNKTSREIKRMTQMVDMVQLRKFTPGRAAFAAKSVRALTTSGEETIATEAARVSEAAQAALEKRRAFRTTQATTTSARGGGKAAELDNQVDRVVSAIHGNTQAFVRAMGEDAPEAAQAKALLAELFPRGAVDMSRQQRTRCGSRSPGSSS
jgi:flagellum-specific peptidoglycan hydrolase FlgJ